MPVNDGGGLDQHHRVQTARPDSVEPDPQQAVDRERAGATRALAPKHMQLKTEGRFSNSTAALLRSRQPTIETIRRASSCIPAPLRRQIANL